MGADWVRWNAWERQEQKAAWGMETASGGMGETAKVAKPAVVQAHFKGQQAVTAGCGSEVAAAGVVRAG
jgi:hypothetical protein